MIVGNEIHGLKVKHLHVGGVLGSGEVQNGIRGCIQVKDGVFNSYSEDKNKSKKRLRGRPVNTLIQLLLFLCVVSR